MNLAVDVKKKTNGRVECVDTRVAEVEGAREQRYFVAKPSIVAIYALFERLTQGFE